MSTIVTRAGKGSALTHDEVDANFNNLNTDKIQSGNTVAALTITSATINGGTISGITDIAIADGGTGASTATAAFNALSPVTTKGDIIVRDGTDNIRLAVGTNDQVLTADSAQASGLKWAAVATGGMTFLGSLTTTSGATQTLSGLDLSSYKQVVCVIKGVSGTATASFITIDGKKASVPLTTTANYSFTGQIIIDLDSSSFGSFIGRVDGSGNSVDSNSPYGNITTYTTATTSLVFGIGSGNFDAGTIRVYGVK